MECWSDGILENWVLVYRNIGSLFRCRKNEKIKIDEIQLKTHYSINPLFHYSMTEAKV